MEVSLALKENISLKLHHVKWCCKSTWFVFPQKCLQNLSYGPVRKECGTTFFLDIFLYPAPSLSAPSCVTLQRRFCVLWCLFLLGMTVLHGGWAVVDTSSGTGQEEWQNSEKPLGYLFVKALELCRTGKCLRKLLRVCLVMIFTITRSTRTDT